jgi:predicted ribosome quality control (RQC) complex YloA/Tae2 family protein
MAKMIDLKIKSSDTILKNDHDLFSDIAEKRINVLRDLQDTFKEFMNKSENFTDDGLMASDTNITGNVATGGGIAIVGVILNAVTSVSLFDITGGVLTAVGLVFAGGSIVLQKRKIMDGYRSEIDKGRIRMEGEVSDKLKNYILNIKKKIDANFNKFDQLIEDEEKQITHLNTRHEFIASRLDEIEKATNIPT